MIRTATTLALFACVLLVGSCGGGSDDGSKVLRAPDPTGAQADDAELVQGRDVFEQYCVSCHGVEGDGGVGPQLSEGVTVETYPELEAEVEVLTDGLGQMPAFEGTLSAEEVQAVARYTREVL